MIHRRIVGLFWMISPLLLLGCASARHVEMHPEGGVVAIPANTNTWPFYYRDKAIALIESGAPGGYEILLEEEAVARRVTHVTTDVKTQPTPWLVLNGEQDPAEGLPGPGSPFPGQMAALALPLGPPQEHATQVAEERDVTEWRIHYRHK